MKKNVKTIAAYNRELIAKNAVLDAMRKQMNTVDEETKQRVEALIAEKQAEVDSLKAKLEELNQDESDRTDEMRALIDELTKKVETAQNSIDAYRKSVVKVSNFVDSKEGMKAFNKVISNCRSRNDFMSMWKSELKANGITPEDLALPAPVLAELTDTWESAADDFFRVVDVTGMKALKVAYDSNEGNSSRAHGHKKGTEKDEQELIFVPKTLRAQMVYKYITLDRETVDFEDEAGVVVRYITRELAKRVMHEVMRAALISDGRNAGDKDKITEIEPIARTVSDAYVTVVQKEAGDEYLNTIANAVDAIEADGDIHLYVSKQVARQLRMYRAASGGSIMFRSLEDVAAELGIAEIHTTKVLAPTESGNQPIAVAFVGKAYKIVGDVTMTGFQNFNLRRNEYEYLTEVYVGGGLAYPKSAAVVYETVE